MTAAWAKAHLPTDHAGQIVLLQNPDGSTHTIDPATLATFTANVPDVASHAALSAAHLSIGGQNVAPADAGWQQYYDWWKAKGHIS